MSYMVALEKAWKELKRADKADKLKVKFLADEYEIDLNRSQILSLSCNIPAPEHIAILVLHYAAKALKGIPQAKGEWISFKELEGGQAYFDAFKKRALDLITRKHGSNPAGLISCLDRLPGKEVKYGDCGIVLDAFDNTPVLITVWGKDDEFQAASNMLFDRSISGIFCTEDVAVLADIISRLI